MAARLGKQIAYSNNVEVQNIRACFSQCGKYRYLLTIPYNSGEQRTEVVSVILKNPSSADEKSADTSVNRIENYVYRNFCRCRELHILNLFAYRATDLEELQKKINQESINSAIGPKNDCFLKISFHSSTYIIVAWGDPGGKINEDHYRYRVEQVHQLLQPYSDKLREVISPYPRHALRWAYEHENIHYQI